MSAHWKDLNCKTCSHHKYCRKSAIMKGSAACEKQLGLRQKITPKKHTTDFWKKLMKMK